MLKNEETYFIGCGCFVPQHDRISKSPAILKVFSFLSGLGNKENRFFGKNLSALQFNNLIRIFD
ncbi:hypothetical protein [Pedobacter agri]|uniref:hypothetical protein n=1 Tax=Pedobacter agri TaxID=454586 RepID=UPI002780526A|nr:hypothetical protein [Pedobacter agri]MDQ1139379.1 hypothetical protein [Pedobacter agri]